MRVGNVIAIILVSIIQLSHALSLEMTTTGLDGTRHSRVGQGAAFIIKVTCHGHIQGAVPIIEGLDNFGLTGRGRQEYTVNGQVTTVYSYQVYAKDIGEYTLGPAQITVQGVKYYADPIMLTVLDPDVAAQEQRKIDESPEILLVVDCGNPTIFLGQKITGTIKLLLRTDRYAISGIDIDRWSKMGIELLQNQKKQGMYSVNGVEYNAVEWPWEFKPDDVGSFAIPACSVMFERSFFSRQQRLFSNGLTVHVQELPPTEHSVNGIGAFQQIQADITPKVSRQGEGMVLTICVKGEGEVLDLVLQDIPDGLRWYSSKQHQEVMRDGSRLFTFEYIVQGLQDGEWEIPKQTFYFYNTESNRYSYLRSGPLFITVQKSNQIVTRVDTDMHESVEIEDSIDDHWYVSDWQAMPHRELPVWIFVLLLCAPLGLMGGCYSYRWCIGKKTVTPMTYKRARTQIEQARREGKSDRVLDILMQFCAYRLGISQVHFTQETFVDMLRKTGVSSEQIEQWHNFASRMVAVSYAGKSEVDPLFYKQAQEWLTILNS